MILLLSFYKPCVLTQTYAQRMSVVPVITRHPPSTQCPRLAAVMAASPFLLQCLDTVLTKGLCKRLATTTQRHRAYTHDSVL